MAELRTELPYVAAVDDEFLEYTCSFCFKMSGDGRSKVPNCAKCHVIRYCSRSCQQDDWAAVHKTECGLLTKIAYICADVPNARVRMTARALIRQRNGDHLSVQAFNGRRFKDLRHLADHLPTDAKSVESNESFFAVLKLYVEPVYDDVTFEEVMEVDSKVNCHQFALTGYWRGDQQDIGRGIYLGFSALTHACLPDAFFHNVGSKASIRLIDTYAPDKFEKLTLAYLDVSSCLRSERQEKLIQNHHLLCRCRLCMDEEREGHARAVACATCPSGICPLTDATIELMCESCSAIHELHPKKAHIMNNVLISKAAEPPKNLKDLMKVIEFYEKCAATLAKKKNVPLADLAFKICVKAQVLGKQEIAYKYAYSFHEVLLGYNPATHARLSIPMAAASAVVHGEMTKNGELSARALALLDLCEATCTNLYGTLEQARRKGDEWGKWNHLQIKELRAHK